jgi:hypothetical protein
LELLCTPFEHRLLDVIERESRRSGAPVSTVNISAYVGTVPPRTLRWWLAKMEAKGMVRRPSPKGGWLPTPQSNVNQDLAASP